MALINNGNGTFLDTDTGQIIMGSTGNDVAQTTTGANAAIPDQTTTGSDSTVAAIVNGIGTFGSTIASILTRTPVTVVNGRPVGVAGSPVVQQSGAVGINGNFLLLVGLAVVLILVLK